MLGFLRRDSKPSVVDVLHARIVEQSRLPAFYATGSLPDTVEGRFEALALHVLLVLRRLRLLPEPAESVAQDLVDQVFAHLEIALRELGIGDMGVPKRMKKIAGAFYDRTRIYDPCIDARDAPGLAAAIADHLGVSSEPLLPLAAYVLDTEASLARCDLAALFAGPPFAPFRNTDIEFAA